MSNLRPLSTVKFGSFGIVLVMLFLSGSLAKAQDAKAECIARFNACYDECTGGPNTGGQAQECLDQCGQARSVCLANGGMGPKIPLDESETENAAGIQPVSGRTSGSTSTVANQDQESMDACTSQHRKAQVACNAQQYEPVAAAALSQFSVSKNSGNIKDACNAAAKASKISLALNGAFATTCKLEASKCSNTCLAAYRYASSHPEPSVDPHMYRDRMDNCESFTNLWMQGMFQSLQDAGNWAQAKNCAQAAAIGDDCTGMAAYDNPSCVEYCMSPKHRQEAMCDQNQCANPRYANTIPCYCPNNPTDPKCTATPFTTPSAVTAKSPFGTLPSNKFGSTTPTFDTGDDGEDQTMQETAGAPVKAASAAYEDNKGGGLGGLGSLGGGAGNGKSGKADGPYNTDIYKGQGGNGGGMFGGGGGGGGLAAYGGRGNSGGDDKDKMDWRKYMPKLNGDKRKPASVNAAMYDAGITAANGLSNFEKVTRKMNEKRPVMLP